MTAVSKVGGVKVREEERLNGRSECKGRGRKERRETVKARTEKRRRSNKWRR